MTAQAGGAVQQPSSRSDLSDFVSRSLSSGTSTYRSGYQPRSSSRGYSYSGYRGGYGRA